MWPKITEITIMKSPSSACLRYHTSENTCDQTGMLDVPYGQGKSLMHGAVYKYVYTINQSNPIFTSIFLVNHMALSSSDQHFEIGNSLILINLNQQQT